jgi:4-oxalocrotonate tautomerase
MPYVRIDAIAGATRDQKAALVADVTQAIVTHLGKKPEQVWVVIDDVPAENWGVAGGLAADRMAAAAPPREDAHAAVSSQ